MLKIVKNRPIDGREYFRLGLSVVIFMAFISGVSAQSFTESGGEVSFASSDYSVSTGTATSGVDWLELNGSVSGLSDLNDSVRFGFEYRENGDSTWNEVFAESLDSSRDFQRRVEGLNSGTGYEFRAVSLEHDRNGSISTKETLPGVFTKSGGQVSFSTNDYSVSTGVARSGVDWLELNGSVSGLSELNDSVRFGFEYREEGTSTWNDVFAESVNSSGSFFRRVEGLNPDTNYEYRAASLEHDRNGSIDTKETLPGVFTKSGGSVSFQTKDYTINTTEAVSGTDYLVLRGELSDIDSELQDPIALYFQYRPKGESTWSSVRATARTNNGFFKERIEGLENGTVYEFRAYSENDVNGSVVEKQTLPGVFTKSGGVVSFATGPLFNVTIQDINEPVIEGSDVEVEALVENEGSDGNSTLELNVSGLGSNSTELELSGGSSTTETLTVPTVEGDEGEYTANFSSDNNFDTQDFNVSTLNPPVDPLPKNDTEPVGLDWDLSAESNSSGIDTGIEFYIVNESGNDLALGGSLSSPGERINVSLENVDLEAGTEYDWYANSTYDGQSAKSKVWNFTTVERPQVTLAEPDNENVEPNPILNVTVDGNSPINVTVGESTGIDFKRVENANPGDTIQVNTSEINDFGDGPNEYWNVSLEAYGAEWNNSDDYYNFTVSTLEGVDYSLQDMSSGDNLSPGDFNGIKVFGKNSLGFHVSSDPSGQEDMNFQINVSNTTDYESVNFGEVDDGDIISVDLSNLGLVEENFEDYSAEAYYLEGSSRVGPDYESNTINFSTHVAEIEFTHPGDNVDEFRGLYNATSNTSYSQVVKVPIEQVSSDSNDLYKIGIANRDLKTNSNEDCYQIEAWNRFGSELAEVQNGNDQCLGGSNP